MVQPKRSVILRIACKELTKLDVGSESDPVVTVALLSGKDKTEIGRTEHLKNTKNPQFTTAINVDYYFEQTQELLFCVYDIDNIATASMNDDELIGKVKVTLGTLVSKGTWESKLDGKRSSHSSITIVVDHPSHDTRLLTLNFTASKLDNKDFMGKSDPYLELSKSASTGTWLPLIRSTVIKDSLNPVWPSLELRAAMLDAECNIKITCFDYDKDGGHDLIGECEMKLAELLSVSETKEQVDWHLINPKKKVKKKSYKNSGILHLKACDVHHFYSFLQYVSSGCQINFTVGVDFTASNGDPNDPRSLHYFAPGVYSTNSYQQAIEAVGSVIQDYDSDKMFPALGFGARIEGTPEAAKDEALHDFALNFNPSNPFCAGISGVVEAYKSALARVELWGPTYFTPIINHVANFARQAAQEATARNYYVLLMLTDGIISDMKSTIDTIVACSHLPMSIIIVGVGDCDFSSMDELDGDGGRLYNQAKQPAARDIVQFVPFNKFKTVGQAHANTAVLAQHVLAEVPSQVESYFSMRRIPPNSGFTATQGMQQMNLSG